MVIDFYNIDQVIFDNQEIRDILTSQSSIFESYYANKSLGNLNKIKKLKIDLLNILNKKDIENLSKYFNEPIFLKKINNNIVFNSVFDFDDCLELNELNSYKYFCLYRNNKSIFLTFWR